MKVGDYVRTKKGIEKITYIRESMTLGGYEKYMTSNKRLYENLTDFASIIKSSPNILKLLEPMDLLYVDIDGGFEGGIIVPRIPETQNELDEFIEFIKSGHWTLKGIITHEQLKSMVYEVK